MLAPEDSDCIAVMGKHLKDLELLCYGYIPNQILVHLKALHSRFQWMRLSCFHAKWKQFKNHS